MDAYHTALSKDFVTFSNVRPTSLVELPNGIIMQNDIVKNGLPDQFASCDFFYAEPPWPHGLKVFNKRAGVADFPYKHMASALNSVINDWQKPTYLIIGQNIVRQLVKPAQWLPTTLNKDAVFLAVWNDEYTGPSESASVILQNLGKKYEQIGEIMSGYGASVKSFLSGGGKRFVAADFDGKCVTVMAAQIRQFNKNNIRG